MSENVDFARSAAQAGLVFAGPSPECIEAFGLKHTARELATQADVPVVPGSNELIQSEDEAVKTAQELGFPVSKLVSRDWSQCRTDLDLHRSC